jgi:hypothetical protein
MKKLFLQYSLFLGSSFILTGLQGALYFSPLPLPAFWFIIFTYYSFQKSLSFSLCINVAHALVIGSFAYLNFGVLLLVLNGMSLSFYLLKERFHTQIWHISLGTGFGLFLLHSVLWLIQNGEFFWAWPPLLEWVGTALATFLFSFPIIFLLDKFDRQIEYERIDTLENLRV